MASGGGGGGAFQGHVGPSDGGFGFGRFGLLAGGRDRGSEGVRTGERGAGGGGRDRSRRRTRTLSGVLRHHGYGRLTSPSSSSSSASASASASSSPYPPPYSHSHHRHHHTPCRSHSNHFMEGGENEHGTLALDPSEEFQVDAIFSAHSDGIIVIVRRAPSV